MGDPCYDGTCSSNSLGAASCQCPEGLSGARCETAPAVCPAALEHGNFAWHTAPLFQVTAFPRIRMRATFRNDTGNTFVFNALSDPDVWVRAGRQIINPPIIIVDEPETNVPPGGEFSYDIVIDTSGLPDEAHEIGFIANERNLYGNVPWYYAGLVSASFDCDLCEAGGECVDPDDCASQPCQNGGTCHDEPYSYSCECAPGFGGPDCAYPLTYCMLIKSQNSSAADGNYTFDVAGRQVELYCHDMANIPREYLNLVRTGEGYNFSTYAPDQTSWYTKVRFNPDTLAVNTQDATFATTVGINVHGWTSMPWAMAADCIGGQTGTANIDLTGTPFALAPDQLTTQGEPHGRRFVRIHDDGGLRPDAAPAGVPGGVSVLGRSGLGHAARRRGGLRALLSGGGGLRHGGPRP
jgi:hypothetical protein